MISMNFNIIKENVRDLLEESKLTQAEFAEKIGMTQPNLSKCLNVGSNNHFTLEEIYNIAVVFGKSIDELIGRTTVSTQLSEETLCRILERLIKDGRVSCVDYELSERVPSLELDDDGEPLSWNKKTTTYKAIIFLNYRQAKDYWDPARIDEFESMEYELKENKRINTFLKSYSTLYEQYDRGEYSEEDFQKISEALLSMPD